MPPKDTVRDTFYAIRDSVADVGDVLWIAWPTVFFCIGDNIVDSVADGVSCVRDSVADTISGIATIPPSVFLAAATVPLKQSCSVGKALRQIFKGDAHGACPPSR